MDFSRIRIYARCGDNGREKLQKILRGSFVQSSEILCFQPWQVFSVNRMLMELSHKFLSSLQSAQVSDAVKQTTGKDSGTKELHTGILP